ncbi:PPOX class F420-dependent oxidoreductase [Streptomyces pactum]|uniref:PPOX class F420-dependent oxidoreductase n=1 Tax=Streptomyces pactum TaxID=68249 RepID=UPI0027DBB742|nr:PPOX class F420-dependent oxidoreductase [Streptomyces pactum]
MARPHRPRRSHGPAPPGSSRAGPEPLDPVDDRPSITRFARETTVLLTSYAPDGSPVATPVNMAVEGDHAYLRAYEGAGNAERMRNNPLVEIAPATARGKPTGPAVRARTQLLTRGGGEDRHAARVLARKHPLVHGVLGPLGHRLRRDRVLHFEVRLVAEDERYPEAGGTGPAPAPGSGGVPGSGPETGSGSGRGSGGVPGSGPGSGGVPRSGPPGGGPASGPGRAPGPAG